MKHITFLLRLFAVSISVFYIAKLFRVTLFSSFMHVSFIVISFITYLAITWIHLAMEKLWYSRRSPTKRTQQNED